MAQGEDDLYTAFLGQRRLATGTRREVLRAVKAEPSAEGLLVFEDATGRQVDFDLRGTLEEVVARAEGRAGAGPGRPKLGVVSREVSLLPRHWEWLEGQRGGISAALRRLVDEARRREPDEARAQRAREAAGRFLWAMAGDLPGFEEATRALYAGDLDGLRSRTLGWPKDVRAHALALAGAAPAAREEAP